MPPNQEETLIQAPAIDVESDVKKEAYQTLKRLGIAGLILLPFMFLSGFAFDDPNLNSFALVFSLSIILYFPVYLLSVLLTIIFANLHLRRLTRYASYLPLINIIIFAVGFLLMSVLSLF